MGKKVSKKMKAFNGFKPMFKGGMPMPPVPPMPFAGRRFGSQNVSKEKESDNNTRKENFKSTLKSFWKQNMDMQKISVDSGKEQWNQFFTYMMDLQDTLSASMPEDTSSLPFAISPKAFMKWAKGFQEMANEHFVEQVDSFMDFLMQGQQQVYDMVASAMSGSDAEDGEVIDEEDIVEDVAEDQE